jgi:protein-S-isoprenylcysteine O-methyltransferase Ste14
MSDEQGQARPGAPSESGAVDAPRTSGRIGLGWPAVRRITVVLAFYAGMGAAVFAAAGNSAWERGWLWLGANGAVIVVNGVLLALLNPEVVNERGKRHSGTKRYDKILTALIAPWYLGQPLVAGLDAGRFGWAPMPLLSAWTGLVLFAISDGVMLWAMIVNRHLETSVRIQDERSHQVVRSGPYRFVRHPMYAGMCLQFLATSMILGSWWSVVPALVVSALFVVRTALEDRTLLAELAGYADFAKHTCYRMIPFIW